MYLCDSKSEVAGIRKRRCSDGKYDQLPLDLELNSVPSTLPRLNWRRKNLGTWSSINGGCRHYSAALAELRARVAAVDLRISALEESLKTLRIERQRLQAPLDAYRYPILTLPTEVTSEIFIHFLPVFPERPPPTGLLSPTLLAQICRTWRSIAFNTPRLWRAIKLDLNDSTPPSAAMTLLKTYTARRPT
ncbi:hypothetical protein C8J57DRAFT_1719396 [Mycena rebaudengoi]|nr:hypothetical protein C8J57DRAFT_1719396 [Mycena rebaudengoi]